MLNLTRVVSDDFIVPTIIDRDDFILRPLSPEYSDLDYDAVMGSKAILGNVFSDSWPEGINSKEDNLTHIKEDFQDFNDRVGFSYIILDPAKSICLGCVYIFPSLYMGNDVAVYYWFNIEIHRTPLALKVEHFIRNWIIECWGIRDAAYPGRDIPWNDWLLRPRKNPHF